MESNINHLFDVDRVRERSESLSADIPEKTYVVAAYRVTLAEGPQSSSTVVIVLDVLPSVH